MNIEDMTPEELRAYAADKEQRRSSLVDRYMNRERGTATPEPWEKAVEFEGETYLVDMRRTSSREFLRRFASYSKALREDGDVPIDLTLDMLDYVFGGKVDEKVEKVVREKLGFDDFTEIYRIESALLDGIEVKN